MADFGSVEWGRDRMSEGSGAPEGDLHSIEVVTAEVADDGTVVIDDIVAEVDDDGDVIATDEVVEIDLPDGTVVIDETFSVADESGELVAIDEELTVITSGEEIADNEAEVGETDGSDAAG
jgi:hypothetical protein